MKAFGLKKLGGMVEVAVAELPEKWSTVPRTENKKRRRQKRTSTSSKSAPSMEQEMVRMSGAKISPHPGTQTAPLQQAGAREL